MKSKVPANQSSRQNGFTLVEIAIVLVIVGLLLGAVLKGQELIFNTKIKSTYNMSRETAAALYAYQDRYRMNPGDDNKATQRFPTANPATTDGNGDGLIAYGSRCQNTGVSNAGENCNALHHLRVAGFIAGAGNEGLRTAFGGIASPARWENYYPSAGNNPALGYDSRGITHKIMSTIDTSFDDGNPATGSVRCRNTAQYDQTNFDARMPDWCSAAM
ncbi:MAG: prepilin-type N-terminal cleavage/methylation domain-containing protein [Burkholderiaceae bacterium]